MYNSRSPDVVFALLCLVAVGLDALAERALGVVPYSVIVQLASLCGLQWALGPSCWLCLTLLSCSWHVLDDLNELLNAHTRWLEAKVATL